MLDRLRILRWTTLCALFMLCASSCASIGNEHAATPLDAASSAEAASSGLSVNAEEMPELSSSYFGVIQLTFANRSANFLRVDAISLDFGGPEQNRMLSVPLGSDLDSWALATAQRLAIRRHNAELAYSTLALLGAFVAGTGEALHQRASPRSEPALRSVASPRSTSRSSTQTAKPFRAKGCSPASISLPFRFRCRPGCSLPSG